MSKKMALRFAGGCKGCGVRLAAGSMAMWMGKGAGVLCLECSAPGSNAGLRETAGGDLVDKDGHIGWVASGPGPDSRETYQNYRGRCEDAPCCGCCNC